MKKTKCISFECGAATAKLPNDSVRLIYLEYPQIRIYSARKEARRSPRLSIFPRKLATIIMNVRRSDAVAF